MDLSVRDVARLIEVPEERVYRLIKEGALPAHRVHDQVRFNPVELQEWAAAHHRKISPELFGAHGRALAKPSLHQALERGGVFHRVRGQTPKQVLQSVTELPSIPPQVDRQLLLQLLVGRESQDGTGVGGGIALPHPRDPLVVPIDEPQVLLSFLETPVDFKAPDGLPVGCLFTLLMPSVRSHLQMLAQLAFVLHDPRLKTLLESQAAKEPLLRAVAALEEGRGDRG